MNKVYYGSVIFFSAQRGFGFLQWDVDGVRQKDLFVHFSDIEMEGYKTLYKGQQVNFEIGKNNRGEAKAIIVTVVKN